MSYNISFFAVNVKIEDSGLYLFLFLFYFSDLEKEGSMILYVTVTNCYTYVTSYDHTIICHNIKGLKIIFFKVG